jgi:peptide/nickel transport system ATP-binding protein
MSSHTYAINPTEAGRAPGEPPLLEAKGISKSFPVRLGTFARGAVSAVDDLWLTAEKGQTVGIVGESGCGKSTAARLILGLIDCDEGEILFEGEDVNVIKTDTYNRRQLRRNLQMVFQDPYSSLNPRASIGELIGFPMKVHAFPADEIGDRVGSLLESVGLHRNHAAYYPHQMSGGQRQRVNIARALALDPKLIVCDEAVSALDKSVQAQVLELLRDQQAEHGFAYLFISHDLNVVEYVSDVVVVMYLGQVVEVCTSERLYEDPQHPYTKALLDSVLTLSRRHEEPASKLEGEIPSPINPPSGCRFRTRCPHAMPICAEQRPAPVATEPGHTVSCHLYADGGQGPVTIDLSSTDSESADSKSTVRRAI